MDAAITIEEIKQLLEQGRLQEVEQKARALLGDPELHLSALTLLCRAKLFQGEADEALQLCDRAIRLAPDTSGFHLLQGLALFKKQNFAKAKSCFDRAQELGGVDPDILKAIVQCHLSLNEYELAAKAAKSLLALGSPDHRAKAIIADLLIKTSGGGETGAVWFASESRLEGFALSASAWSKRLEVVVSRGSRILGAVIADRVAPFLEEAGIGNGAYGFVFDIPEGTQAEPLRVSVLSGGVELLGSPLEPISISREYQEGLLEAGGQGRITGFAWEPANPRRKVRVRLWDDLGNAKTLTADAFNADLLRKNIGDGNHAFSTSWPLPDDAPLCVQVFGRLEESGAPLFGSPIILSDPVRMDRIGGLVSQWLRDVEKSPDAPPPMPEELRAPGVLRHLRIRTGKLSDDSNSVVLLAASHQNNDASQGTRGGGLSDSLWRKKT